MAHGKRFGGDNASKRHTTLPTTKEAANRHQKISGAKDPSKESCNLCEEERGGFSSASLETYSTDAPGAVIDETPVDEAGDALQVSFQI